MKKYKLIGSASDLSDLILIIENKWSWSFVSTVKNNDQYLVFINGKIQDDLRIIKRGKRFRFERIEK